MFKWCNLKKKHQKARIIWYVNYSIKRDPENYYRERLMLFYPWKNESVYLIVGSKSNEDSYKKKQKPIEIVHKEYEPYNDVLEEAIENAEVHERGEENINDDEEINTVSNMDKYAFFDPDRHDSLKIMTLDQIYQKHIQGKANQLVKSMKQKLIVVVYI